MMDFEYLPGALPSPLFDHPVRYVDTETAGGSIGPDALIEIAIIDELGTVLLDTLVDPGRSIDPRVTAIHGITDEMVQHAPDWPSLQPVVTALLAGAEFVAHGVAFDRAVIGPAADEVSAFTCTLDLCRRKLGRTRRLSAAAAMAGFVLDATVPDAAFGARPTSWHRALADAQGCRAVHRWLSALPDLTSEQRAEARREETAAKRERQQRALAWDRRLVRVQPRLCPEPVMAGQPWTQLMDDRLIALWRAGKDVLDILEDIPRTPRAVFARLAHLGVIPAALDPYAKDPR
ncbi:MAG TPA: 3'-5' exonuclease [Stellaceae bacterium]|nr:3'-5' exonuclease [Stellaceae bacterium]